MSYEVSKLTTVAECDQAIALAHERKAGLLFEQTLSFHGTSEQDKLVSLTKAKLVGVSAEIIGLQAAVDALEPGEQKTNFEGRLRNLQNRKLNLEARLVKSGPATVLDGNLDNKLLETQLDAIDAYILEVEARKATL
jgi:hypothetical protein